MAMLMAEVALSPPAPTDFDDDQAKHVAVLGPYGGSKWMAEGLLGEISGRNDVEEVTYTPLDVALNDGCALQEAVEGAHVLALAEAMAAIRRFEPSGMVQVDAVVPVERKSPAQQLAGFACLNVHEMKHTLTGPDRMRYAQLLVGRLGYMAMHPKTHLSSDSRQRIGQTSTSRTLIKMRAQPQHSGVEFNVHAFDYGDQMGYNQCPKSQANLRSNRVNVRRLKAPYPDHEIFFRRPREMVNQVYGPDPS